MNKSVYIESSVIGYLTARPSRGLVIAGHQVVTAEWWEDRRLRYDVYVSPLVVEEISAGDASVAAERLRVIADIPSVVIVAEAELFALVRAAPSWRTFRQRVDVAYPKFSTSFGFRSTIRMRRRLEL